MNEKEVDNNLETKVENLQKSNKVMKGLLTVLGIAILVAGCFGIGFILGEKSESNEEEKEVLDDSQEETDGKEESEEEDELDNTISDVLRKDLDKKVELTTQFVVTGLYAEKSETIKNVFNENKDAEAYFAFATYNYYLYKTGAKRETYTTKDSNFPTCYEDAQDGYCLVAPKAEIEKYNKELYNANMNIFNLGDWTTTKGDKVYFASVPWNGAYETKTDSVVSVVRNNDVIEYTAKQSIYLDNLLETMTIKYIFKINENGNFYLYSFEKI